MRFSDGMEFELEGPLRIVRRRDGYYVVGEGMLCPVDDPMDGRALIKELKIKRAKKVR